MQQDIHLKNFTKGTSHDYYRFVEKFLDFTHKKNMTITYADIRRFIFHLKDIENKKASTISVYTAAIRFFFEYTLGYVWDSFIQSCNHSITEIFQRYIFTSSILLPTFIKKITKISPCIGCL